jgi:hypothetical protein
VYPQQQSWATVELKKHLIIAALSEIVPNTPLKAPFLLYLSSRDHRRSSSPVSLATVIFT